MWIIWLSLLAGATRASGGDSSKEKYNFLLQRTLASSTGTVLLDDHEAKRYLIDPPRTYDAVVLFTTRSCSYCKKIEKAFHDVAQVHKDHQMYLPRKHKDAETVFKPMFFLIVNVASSSQPIVDAYKISQFPTAVLSLNTEIYLTDPFERKNYLNQYLWRITQNEGVVNEVILLRWLNRLTGNTHIQIKQSIWLFFEVMLFVFGLLFVLGVLYVYAPFFVLNEKVWLVMGLGIFMIGAGGFFSTSHNGAPFVGMKKDGPEFIQRGSRSQYGIEGFLMTFVMFVIAFSLMLITRLLKAKGLSNTTLFVSLFVLVVICLRAVSFLESIFTSKNFYNPTFYPPDYYTKGPLTVDKGLIS